MACLGQLNALCDAYAVSLVVHGMCTGCRVALLSSSCTVCTAGRAGSILTVWCLQSTVLIMAHMTKEPFSVQVWPLVVLSAVLINDRVGIVNYNAAALAALAIILAGYLLYVKVTAADAAASVIAGYSGHIAKLQNLILLMHHWLP